MEELLNKLIEKGWKPRGKDYAEVLVYDGIIRFERRFGADCIETFRTLTSKESGLWQFVCENGMVNVDETEVYYFWLKRKGTLDRGHYYLSEAGEDIRTNNFEYRLIESALCDGDKLEEFLLSNIKIGNED